MEKVDPIRLIRACAEIPSFSTFEGKAFPFIESIVSPIKKAAIQRVKDNNIVITVPGANGISPVALTAHLDKIDHFRNWGDEPLPVSLDESTITGQLDDSAGVGICLALLQASMERAFPPLLILLSEMEEHGEYENGSELFCGIGSCRIAQFLIDTGMQPSLFITVDTTPQFNGREGVALYSRFWEKCSIMASERLVRATNAIEEFLTDQFPFLTRTNGSNDYINYGMLFNADLESPVPSIAIEPGICPYHEQGEKVHVSDAIRVFDVVSYLLEAVAQKRIPGLL
jgi:hypothetical protein